MSSAGTAPIFFGGWHALGRALVLAPLGYLALLLFLRLSGKRTLTQMNPFGFILNVVLGSALADVILSPTVTLAEGVAVLAVLIVLQNLIAWLTSRSPRLEYLINGDPVLLFHRGQFLDRALRRHRISEEEIRAAIRAEGSGQIEQIQAVVLETDGKFSVVRYDAPDTPSAMRDVEGMPGARTRGVG